MIGAFPGTFNPPTHAHLEIARAAMEHARLDRVDLVVSRHPLLKEHVEVPTFDDRVALLEHVAASRDWLGVRVSSAQLIVDVVEGYDRVIVGADKWLQIIDVAWYGNSARARDDAVGRLRDRVLVVPRGNVRPDDVAILDVAEHYTQMSSSLARATRPDLMLPEAREFDDRTGAWSDPSRYPPQP